MKSMGPLQSHTIRRPVRPWISTESVGSSKSTTLQPQTEIKIKDEGTNAEVMMTPVTTRRTRSKETPDVQLSIDEDGSQKAYIILQIALPKHVRILSS
jgi:hypothetical protein